MSLEDAIRGRHLEGVIRGCHEDAIRGCHEDAMRMPRGYHEHAKGILGDSSFEDRR